jgi:hypothetical protein
MISTPKTLGRTTWRVASATTASRSRTGRIPRSVLGLGEPPDAVLDDDDGAVDDQSEIERAEAHQVPADAAAGHADEREQHRERNHERRQERGAGVPEQQEEDRDHEQRALEEVRSTVAIVRSTRSVRS